MALIFFVHVAVRAEIDSMHFSIAIKNHFYSALYYSSLFLNDRLKKNNSPRIFIINLSEQKLASGGLPSYTEREIQNIQLFFFFSFGGCEGWEGAILSYIVDTEDNQTEVIEPHFTHTLYY